MRCNFPLNIYFHVQSLYLLKRQKMCNNG
jgi:hypothetical protein